MKNYLIRLELTIGGFEKHSIHLVRSKNEKIAKACALYGECHCTDILIWGEKSVEDDCGGMVYTIDSCDEVSQKDSAVLQRLGFILLRADASELKECGHPDFQ